MSNSITPENNTNENLTPPEGQAFAIPAPENHEQTDGQAAQVNYQQVSPQQSQYNYQQAPTNQAQVNNQQEYTNTAQGSYQQTGAQQDPAYYQQTVAGAAQAQHQQPVVEPPQAQYQQAPVEAQHLTYQQTAAVPAQAQYQQDPPQKKAKKSKKPFIIAGVVVLVIALGVAGFFVYQEVSRSNAYNQAQEYFNNAQYAEAETAFRELGDYQDAQAKKVLSGQYKTFAEGQDLFEEGSYEDARAKFENLLSSDLQGVEEWINACDYALADELYYEGSLQAASSAFAELGDYEDAAERSQAIKYEVAEKQLAEGDPEAAYNTFLALGDYSDAAARAAAIPQAFPATGILYQAEGSYYAYAAVEIQYLYSEGASFYKIYNGETLVGSLFLNANSTQRIYLTPGTYTIKEGTGDMWFGHDLAFGKNGYYSVMTFDDTGTSAFSLGDGDLVTITINSGTAGNISEESESYSNF